jgi:hypothetical protein
MNINYQDQVQDALTRALSEHPPLTEDEKRHNENSGGWRGMKRARHDRWAVPGTQTADPAGKAGSRRAIMAMSSEPSPGQPLARA